jgi:hypothetical protein
MEVAGAESTAEAEAVATMGLVEDMLVSGNLVS